MIANLCILKENFNCQASSQEDEKTIKDQLKNLFSCFIEILTKHKFENNFCIDPKIFDQNINGKDIFGLLEDYLSKDEKGVVYSIFANTSSEIEINASNVNSKIMYSATEKECFAMVVLGEKKSVADTSYIMFDTYNTIHDYETWLTLRRQIIGNHPDSPEYFMKQAEYCFPKLRFSEECPNRISEFLNDFSRQFVYHLSCLNDGFIKIIEKNFSLTNPNHVLSEFAGQYGLDRAGSIQGTPEKSADYTFTFIGKKLRCGPHFKIRHDNDRNTLRNGKKIQVRIYFNYENALTENVIYIGSMGPHI